MTSCNFKTLKEKILSSKNFNEIFDYFFSKFAEQSAFYDLGQPSQDDFLYKVLTTVGKNQFGPTAELSNFRMTEIPDYHFIHGTCFMDDHIGLVIYFSDIQTGLASINMGGTFYHYVHLTASTLQGVERHPVVISNDKTVH